MNLSQPAAEDEKEVAHEFNPQNEADPDEGDAQGEGSVSGIVCPAEPREVEKEVLYALKKLVGDQAAAQLRAGMVAVGDWAPLKGDRLKEMTIEGFFTMLSPDVFVDGSCDITIKRLRTPKLGEWLEHIYWAGDGRVAAQPLLKFALLNLKLRTEALSQGRYVVAQQLNDAHLDAGGLLANLDAGDDSVPRKVISVGSNIVNSDPYWKERKRDVDSLHVWRKYEAGDLAACTLHGASNAWPAVPAPLNAAAPPFLAPRLRASLLTFVMLRAAL